MRGKTQFSTGCLKKYLLLMPWVPQNLNERKGGSGTQGTPFDKTKEPSDKISSLFEFIGIFSDLQLKFE